MSPKTHDVSETGRARPSGDLASDAWVANNVRLEQIGREITARVKKLDNFGAKAVDHVDSIDHLLGEAEKLCKTSEIFEAFKQRHCPGLGQSRTYELLAIKEGRKSLEDIRALTRARVNKHRATKKHVTEKPSVTLTNGQSVDPNELGAAAQSQITNALAAPREIDAAETSAEAPKALYATEEQVVKVTIEPEPIVAPQVVKVTTTEAMIQDAAAESENERNEITQILDARLPKLMTVDKQKLLAYIINHPALANVKPPRREKAIAA
jgi:hypothetical protein